MLQIKDLAKHIENRLNSNSSGFTFKIHTDTGEYISATRSQYDYNTVIQIINGIATVTSVENSPTNDGTVISSMVVRCELVIPMRDTEEDVYQLTEDNPDGEFIETGNINYITSLRSMLDNFAQEELFTTLEDDNGKTYTITAGFSYAESGTRAQRVRVADSLTYVIYGYYNIIENGENSKDYIFVLDGEKIPYRNVTFGRRPIAEADVYATTPKGVATSTSTASQLYISLEVPALSNNFNKIVKNFVLNGESNTVHLLTVIASDSINNYIVQFGDTSYTASGILNVGGTVSFVESVNDYELLELPENLLYASLPTGLPYELVFKQKNKPHNIWVPNIGLYYTEDDSYIIFQHDGVVVASDEFTLNEVR